MHAHYAYDVVDVFTTTALEGNPLAVFPDARGLADATMQRIARELNLSETAFLSPATDPRAALAVRIFTPAREMPFAGHPTVGAAFVARERGLIAPGLDRFLLEERIGLVPVRVERSEPRTLWLTTPAITFGPEFSLAAAARAAGVDLEDLMPQATPQIVSAGNPFIFVALRSVAAVDRAETSLAALAEIGAGLALPAGGTPVGLFVFAPTPAGAYSRMFAPEFGVTEDPATGSATGPLAAYLLRNGLMPAASGTRIVSEQGVKMGRRSLLHVHLRGEAGCEGIEVGGDVVAVATATMTLPMSPGSKI